ncbi:hypothetical protein DRP77_11205 [Candidatus Poribacteria bacterium]|nr:MAG: hypothetical protein DRP77_11205 [Candidatus Poribacteria bacterium]
MLGIIRSLRRRLRKSKGYTLVELAAVTAIAAGLTAVVLPIAQQQISEAKKTQAIEEAKQLATAVMRFWSDTGSLPNDWDADGDGFETSEYGAVTVLYTGTGSSNELPAEDSGLTNKWISGTNKASIANYLLTNIPGASNTPGYTNWNGPYLGTAKEKVALDPWGHCYLINVQPADSISTLGDDPATVSYAIFVISAGPDGIIQTNRLQAVNLFSVASGSDDIVVRIR